jgi:hypothetical protein
MNYFYDGVKSSPIKYLELIYFNVYSANVATLLFIETASNSPSQKPHPPTFTCLVKVDCHKSQTSLHDCGQAVTTHEKGLDIQYIKFVAKSSIKKDYSNQI